MSKRYQNPISKVETVMIPTWEYADLVKASTLTMVTKKLVDSLDDYKLRDVLRVMFNYGGKGEDA